MINTITFTRAIKTYKQFVEKDFVELHEQIELMNISFERRKVKGKLKKADYIFSLFIMKLKKQADKCNGNLNRITKNLNNFSINK